MRVRISDAARSCYRTANGMAALATLSFVRRDGRIAVSYGGARAGDGGGPLVKVGLLTQRFPEHKFDYSLLYVLSNAIYLSRRALAAIARAGVPIVLNQNGVFYPGWYPRGWERENERMAMVHSVASHVFFQSEFCRRCTRLYLGAYDGPSEILYNAVDTAHFSPGPAPRNGGPFIFLLTGKFGATTAYRLTSSLEGLAAARKGGLDVALIVAGAIDPTTETESRRLCDRLGIAEAVTFTGRYRQVDAPSTYGGADAYLMTKHNDPCPNVVLEALASGLPVLYSASGGVPELVGEEAGIGLAVPDTFEETPVPAPAAIAEGMAKIMHARNSMRVAARARAVARFGLTAWLDRHAALFAQLVGDRVRARSVA